MGGALEYLVKLRGKSHHALRVAVGAGGARRAAGRRAHHAVAARPPGGHRRPGRRRALSARSTQVDKLVAERPSEAEGAEEGAVEFLVKWKLLTYAEMTWEAEEDIEEEAAAGRVDRKGAKVPVAPIRRAVRARARGSEGARRPRPARGEPGVQRRPHAAAVPARGAQLALVLLVRRRAIPARNSARNSSRNSAQFSDGLSITAPQAPQTECDPRRRDGARQNRAVGVVPPLPPFDAGAVGAIPRRRAAVDAVALAARAGAGPRSTRRDTSPIS